MSEQRNANGTEGDIRDVGEKPLLPEQMSLGMDWGWGPLRLKVIMAGLRECLATALFLYFTILMIMHVEEDHDASASKLMISFNFGMSIFVLVYIFASKTGANVNPAVSFSLMISKRISVSRGLVYIFSQCMGATIGTALARATNETMYQACGGGVNKIAPGVSDGMAFLAETIGTFFLVLTVLHGTEQDFMSKSMGPQLPLAIGMTVFIAHLGLIPIDGCSINPARSFGPAVVSGNWGGMAVFWFGPLFGASFATVIHEVLTWADYKSEQDELDRAKAAAQAAAAQSASVEC